MGVLAVDLKTDHPSLRPRTTVDQLERVGTVPPDSEHAALHNACGHRGRRDGGDHGDIQIAHHARI